LKKLAALFVLSLLPIGLAAQNECTAIDAASDLPPYIGIRDPISGIIHQALCVDSTNNKIIIPSLSAGTGAVSGTGTPNMVTKWTGTTVVGNSSIKDDGIVSTRTTNGLNTAGAGLGQEYTNANPGSTTNKLVCIDSTGKAFTCGTGNTTGVAGSAISGAGNSGTVVTCLTQCPVLYDNQTTVGHVAIVSTTAAGELHDTGTSNQTSGVDNFIVDAANGGAGTTALTEILTPRNFSYQNSGLGGKTTVQFNGTPTLPIANVNSTTPAAESGYILGKVQASNSAGTTSGSIEIPITGNAAKAVSATSLGGSAGASVCQDGAGNITGSGCTGGGLTNVVMPAAEFASSIVGSVETVTKQNQAYGSVWRVADSGSTSPPYIRFNPPATCHVATTSSPFTCALTSPSLAGSLIVPILYTGNNQTFTVTDDQGQSYTLDGSGNNGVNGRIFHFANSVAGVSTITFTPSSGSGDSDIFLIEIVNAATSSVVDGSASETDFMGCGGTISLPGLTTTVNNDIIISTAAHFVNDDGLYTAGLGSIFLGQFLTGISTGGNYYPAAQYTNATFSKAYSPTMNCVSRNGYVGLSVAYKGLSSPAGQQPYFGNISTPQVATIGVGPLYTSSGVTVNNPNVHSVYGSCVLGTSCSITLTGAAAFTGSTTYQCTGTDQTAAAAVKFAPSSGSAFALTGTGTDTLGYICNGY